MRLNLLFSFIPIAVNGFHLPKLIQQDLTSYRLSVDNVKVPVQLGVMSRCPDALLCENVFNDVRRRAADKISLSLVYIAKINNSEPDFGLTCMHGAQECAGNIQQLCVAKHEPSVWWEFIQCQNYEGQVKVGSPDLAFKCAKAVGFDWEESKTASCAGLDASGKSSEGITLLKDSVALAQDLGVKSSCTVLISGQEVCIHDGTWKKCDNGHTVNDFVRQIDEEYNKLNQD